MEAAGGTVLRTWRADFEDEQIAKEIAADRADWEQLKAEYAQASAEAKARLKVKLDGAKASLDATQKRLETRLGALDKELSAKVAAMEQQVADAKAEAREKIKQRISVLRSDDKTRSEKLKAAWSLAKQALAAQRLAQPGPRPRDRGQGIATSVASDPRLEAGTLKPTIEWSQS